MNDRMLLSIPCRQMMALYSRRPLAGDMCAAALVRRW
jgi:hypothetical protein